jgi:hypothetical protein
VDGEPSQQFRYNPLKGQILFAGEGNGGGVVIAAGNAGNFGAVGIDSKPSALWRSSDLGYIHGDSNHPMVCNCIAVCGGE